MPIFDFECKDCKVIEEHMVKADVMVCCPKCSVSMDKLVSGKVAFDLKGKGFHKQGFSVYK